MVLNVHTNHTAYQGRREMGQEEISLYTFRYTVTTRLTPALRWAAMRAILMFHKCEGQSHETVCEGQSHETVCEGQSHETVATDHNF